MRQFECIIYFACTGMTLTRQIAASIVTERATERFILLGAILTVLSAGEQFVFLRNIGKHVRDGLQPSFPWEAIGSRIERRASGFGRDGGDRGGGRAHATSSSVFKAH